MGDMNLLLAVSFPSTFCKRAGFRGELEAAAKLRPLPSVESKKIRTKQPKIRAILGRPFFTVNKCRYRKLTTL